MDARMPLRSAHAAHRLPTQSQSAKAEDRLSDGMGRRYLDASTHGPKWGPDTLGLAIRLLDGCTRLRSDLPADRFAVCLAGQPVGTTSGSPVV